MTQNHFNQFNWKQIIKIVLIALAGAILNGLLLLTCSWSTREQRAQLTTYYTPVIKAEKDRKKGYESFYLPSIGNVYIQSKNNPDATLRLEGFICIEYQNKKYYVSELNKKRKLHSCPVGRYNEPLVAFFSAAANNALHGRNMLFSDRLGIRHIYRVSDTGSKFKNNANFDLYVGEMSPDEYKKNWLFTDNVIVKIY